jgi:hypothetical protein
MPIGQRVAHVLPEARFGLTYPLRLALAESPEGLLEPETHPDDGEPVSLGGDLVEDARELTQTVLPTIEALVAASSCREPRPAELLIPTAPLLSAACSWPFRMRPGLVVGGQFRQPA